MNQGQHPQILNNKTRQPAVVFESYICVPRLGYAATIQGDEIILSVEDGETLGVLRKEWEPMAVFHEPHMAKRWMAAHPLGKYLGVVRLVALATHADGTAWEDIAVEELHIGAKVVAFK